MNKCTWMEHPTCLPKKRVGLNLNSFCIHETMSMFVHIASTHARKRWHMFVYLAVIKHLFSWHLLACWIENEDDTWIVWASHLPLLWTQCHLELWWVIIPYHLQDTNSLASVSAMSLLCLSALSSSAAGKNCVQYRVRGMGVEAWQSWVGVKEGTGNEMRNEEMKKCNIWQGQRPCRQPWEWFNHKSMNGQSRSKTRLPTYNQVKISLQ